MQGYNVQAAVDHDSHLVVGQHVSQATNDKQEVEPALNELAKVEDTLGKPEALVADAGYHSKENVEQCVEQGIDPYIAGSRERHNQPLEERMKAPAECPEDADAVTAMQHRMQTAEGKAIYGKRKGDRGDGVRGDQGGVGISALLSAWITGGRGRMVAGVHRVESEAAACSGRRIGDRWVLADGQWRSGGHQSHPGERFQSRDHCRTAKVALGGPTRALW